MNVMSTLETLFWIGIYLAVGFVTYRVRWPRGFVEAEPDSERQQLLRRGRRRVLPIPDLDGGDEREVRP